MTQLYRIEEKFTNGWQLIDEHATKLTKEECQRKLEAYIIEGYNPAYLRAVPDVE
jgi:hypothetical protein